MKTVKTIVAASVLSLCMALRADLKFIDYVETDGNGSTPGEYVLLDYTPTSNTVIEVDAQLLAKNTTHCFFCSRGSQTTERTFTLFYLSDSGLKWDYNRTTLLYGTGMEDLERHMVRCTRDGLWIDGEKKIDATPASYIPANKMMLFASYTCATTATPAPPSSNANYAKMRLYSFKAWDDGGATLKVDLRPCIDDDCNVGLYDSVSGKTYYNLKDGKALIPPPQTYEIPSTYDDVSGMWVGDVVALTNAMAKMRANDTISLSKGVYDVAFMTNSPMQSAYESGYGISLLLLDKSNVEVRGTTGDPEDVIVDAKGAAYRVFELKGASSRLRDLTIRGGNAGDTCARYNFRNGGGALLVADTAFVSNCIFTACYAGRGGGAIAAAYSASAGNKAAYDSTFYGNSSGGPGGGAIWKCGLVSGCTVVSNTATAYGGGLAECTTVTNCHVAYNYAPTSGGGVYKCAVVVDSTIEGCSSGGAYGGSYCGCTFRDNAWGSLIDGIRMERCDVSGGSVSCLTNLNCVFHELINSSNHVWCVGNVNYPEGRTGVQVTGGISGFELVRGCLVTNCLWGGVGSFYNSSLLRCSKASSVENCTFADNSYRYFGRDLKQGNSFVNCAIVRNKSLGGAESDLPLHDSTKFCFSNCVWNVKGTWDHVTRDEAYQDGENWELGAGVDPKFVGNGEHPYTPKLKSPLREYGMVLGWMSDATDYADNPRLRYGKVDVGAYQCWLTPTGFILSVH